MRAETRPEAKKDVRLRTPEGDHPIFAKKRYSVTTPSDMRIILSA